MSLAGYDLVATTTLVIALLTLGARAHGLAVRAAGDVAVSLAPQSAGGFNVIVARGEEREILGHIGRTLPSIDTSITELDNGVTAQVGAANLTVTSFYEEDRDAYGIRISWDAGPLQKLQDCFDFSTKHWYGGPMHLEQKIPIETNDLENWSCVSKEQDNGAIVERYWLNSAGEYYYVHPQVPLFVDYHHVAVNHICFTAQVQAPYSSRRTHTELTYDIWFLSNAKTAHQHAVSKYLGKPSGVPDYRMIQHPIWSTWAQYARDINENNLIDFANTINDYGFLNSQLEIDDLWETCYGSFEIDINKFPNFTGLVQNIKDLGFRVTLWIHPFINKNCEPHYSEALNNGYFVLTEEGSPDTTWWNGNGTTAGYIDFTNADAASWWAARVQTLADLYGIDSFKFDAGESSFSPQIPVQNGDIDLHPHHIVEDYVRTLTQFGSMIEFRAGSRTQDLPNFVRMVDRDSIWGLNNGLPTIVTTTIQMNLNG
ncbi:Myogenesis-regulating glycosidase [Eumeta japonica]|uniref:Myogenesis-regulating glycosidase n=1 Tax=Eumeta variegata TaxID=151549 RepID=A0A4C1TXF0_EUMVA|nr:Myogenesis-regulating glycosidase [Eumeta japonica]